MPSLPENRDAVELVSTVSHIQEPERKAEVHLEPPAPHVSRDDLFLVARSGDFSGVHALLSRDGNAIVDERDDDGHSLLHWAAFFGNVAACRHLLESDAEVDARAANLQTALMWACLKGHVACANVLLDRGRADLRLGRL